MSSNFSKSVLSTLTTAALSLPGIALAEEAIPNTKVNEEAPSISNFGEIKTDVKYTNYREKSHPTSFAGTRERYSIDVWQGFFLVPYKNLEFSLSLQRDAQTGASAAGNVPESIVGGAPNILIDGRSGATIVEDRNEVSLGLARNNPNSIDSFNIIYSSEQDYKATAGVIGESWSFNKSNTVISTLAGISYDEIHPTIKYDEDILLIRGHKITQNYYVSLKQDLTKYNFAQISLDFRHDSGLLDDPYKSAWIYGNALATGQSRDSTLAGFIPAAFLPPGTAPLGITASRERRPKTRIVWTPMLRFVTKLPYIDSSLHLDYRFTDSSWGNQSHTFEAAYYQTFIEKIRFTPRIRYYTQSRAKFYAPIFNVTGPGVGNPISSKQLIGNNFSTDSRLSGFGTLAIEAKLSYDILDSVTFGLTGGYYKRDQRLKWGKKDKDRAPNFKTIARYGSAELRFKL